MVQGTQELPMKSFLYRPGLRVRIRRGSFPMGPDMVGRAGLIVAPHSYEPIRYGVTLDGETEVRDFAEDELESLDVGSDPEGRGATGPGVGPTPSGGSGGQH